MIGQTIGPYQILAKLGAGGMGEVYRARDTRLERDVAIKILPESFASDPDRLMRFEREAKTLASLNHPYIAQIYGLEANALVMELVEGEDLSVRIARGPIPLDEALPIAKQIAEALEAAHEQGIIHRDLKPANVKVRPDGTVKVLDFGLAKAIDPGSGIGDPGSATITSPAMTMRGVILGTAAYMSPEQARGRSVDRRADVWAFGVVLYEMLTGRAAFSGESVTDVLAAVVTREPDWAALPANVPPSIRQLLSRCLDRDSKTRLRDIGEARVAIANVSRAPIDTNTARGVVVQLAPYRGAIGFVAALLIVGAIAGVYFTQDAAPVAAPVTPAIDLEVVQVTNTGNAELPSVSPDGRYVAYVQRHGAEQSIWIRQTETDSNVQIVPASPGQPILSLNVTADGNFVDFVRGQPRGTLWRVPFLGGTPRQLFDNIWTPVGWSPDRRQLAFLRNQSDLIVTGPEATNERVLVAFGRESLPYRFGNAWPATAPSWSPDGRRVVLRGGNQLPADQGRDEWIAIVDVATGAVERVAVPLRTPGSVAWLSDDSLVLNQAADIGRPRQLWRMAWPGGEVSRLTNDLNDYNQISLTADRANLVTARNDRRVSIWLAEATGARPVVFVRPTTYPANVGAYVGWAGARLLATRSSQGSAIAAIAVPGGTAVDLVRDATLPAGTRDGARIVYRSLAENSIWLMEGEGRAPRKVLDDDDVDPLLTPDGQTLVFRSPRSGATHTLWALSIATGSVTQLWKAFVPPRAFDVSPDDSRLAFVEGNAFIGVCELPACTSPRELSLSDGRGLGRIRWTPDGRSIALLDTASLNLIARPIDGRPAYPLTQFTSGSITDFAWSPDGTRLAIARATTTNDIVMFKGVR